MARAGRSLTLAPPDQSARRPNPLTAYRALATAPFLRTHRVTVAHPPSRLDGLPPLVDAPTISVIMPVRQEAAFIDRSFRAVLEQQEVRADEVIHVDGSSDDGTGGRRVRHRRWPDVPVTHPRQPGADRADPG